MKALIKSFEVTGTDKISSIISSQPGLIEMSLKTCSISANSDCLKVSFAPYYATLLNIATSQ